MNPVEPGGILKMPKTPGEIKWNGPKIRLYNDEIFLGLLKLDKKDYEEMKQSGAI